MNLNNYIGQFYKGVLHHKYDEVWHDGNDWGRSFGEFGFSIRNGEVIDFLRESFPELDYASSLVYFSIQYDDFESETNPGSPYCSETEDIVDVWKMYVEAVPEDMFRVAQWNYAKKQYDSTLKEIKLILNPNAHSRIAQELIWGWSLESDPKTIKKYLTRMEEDDLDTKLQYLPVEELVELFFKYRAQEPKYENNAFYFKPELDFYKEQKDLYDLFPVAYSGECNGDGTRATGLAYDKYSKYRTYRVYGYIKSNGKPITMYNSLIGSLRNNIAGEITDLEWHRVHRRLDEIGCATNRLWRLQDEDVYVTADPKYVTFVKNLPKETTNYEKGKYELLQRVYVRKEPNVFCRTLTMSEIKDESNSVGKQNNSMCKLEEGIIVEATEIINKKNEAWMKYKNGYICIEINGHKFAKNK